MNCADSSPPTLVKYASHLTGQARRGFLGTCRQITTSETGGFISRPKAVKQSKHESAHVSFCDPVRGTGFSKQTIKRN
jgi:hypothetical protein